MSKGLIHNTIFELPATYQGPCHTLYFHIHSHEHSHELVSYYFQSE